jgi:hypothetical protein
MYLKIAVPAFIALSLAAAFDAEAKKKHKPNQQCELAGAWAGLAMQARQMGASITDQMDLAKPEIGGSKAVLLRAYEYPRYKTFERRQRAAEDFRAEIEQNCYDHIQ